MCQPATIFSRSITSYKTAPIDSRQIHHKLTMFRDLFKQISLSSVLVVFVGALFVILLRNKYCTGLNHIPGPWLAGFTNFYRLFKVWGRRPELWHISLHKQYGDLVRIGPRTVSCSDNRAAKKIYALNAGFVKVINLRIS